MEYPCIRLRQKQKLDFLFVLPWFGSGAGLQYPMIPSVGVEFPFSIAILMAHLENHHCRTGVLDLNLEAQPLSALETTLRVCQPEMVGISSYSANISNAARVAARVKQLQEEICVVLGGFHATALPSICMEKYLAFDYLIQGEGEIPLVHLVQNLLNGLDVTKTPNLGYRNGDQVVLNPVGPILEDLDKQPFPLVDRFPLDRYVPTPLNFFRLPSIGLMSSRGCPFQCTFCATHFQWNRKVRMMSRKLVVEWMEKLLVDYGIRDFRFYDDTFTLARSKVVEFCEELLHKKLDVVWNCYSRVDTIDEDTAALMKRAGCYQVKFGVEAGTESTLKRIKKQITLEKAARAIQLAKKAGLETKASFMFGIHDESLEASLETLRFALKLSPSFATFQNMMIHPGSEDFNEYERAGKIPKGYDWEEPLLVSTQDHASLRQLLKSSYRLFYLRPQFLLTQLLRFVQHPGSQFLRLSYMVKYFFSVLFVVKSREGALGHQSHWRRLWKRKKVFSQKSKKLSPTS